MKKSKVNTENKFNIYQDLLNEKEELINENIGTLIQLKTSIEKIKLLEDEVIKLRSNIGYLFQLLNVGDQIDLIPTQRRKND